VEVVSGCHLFIRQEVFDAIGGFDINFFLYCEEEDLAFRVHYSGYEVFVVPQAKNRHIGGASTSKNIDISKEFVISFLYLYRKHYGFLKTLFLQIFLLLRYLKKSTKNRANLQVVSLLLRGAHLKYSLRHKQAISKHLNL